MSVTQRPFGALPNGQAVTEYVLTNRQGASVGVLDFGGILTQILVPDREGRLGDVNLGFDHGAPYAQNEPYLGALVGRVGNRIAGARFTLEGKEYLLGKNNGENNLHGGPQGFNLRFWTAAASEPEGVPTLTLSLVSPDGDQGFPGTLSVTVVYRFTDEGELSIRYHATTDKTTLCNLTNHAYFNLDGQDSGTIENLELQIFADALNETDNALIPTGTLLPTQGLLYGFQSPTRLGEVLAQKAKDPALANANGVDCNYCLGRKGEKKVCAKLYSPQTGRLMTVVTDQPGVQVYTGQGLTLAGKGGAYYGPYAGICLETQHYPDAIHHPAFDSIVLRPQDVYDSETCYRFEIA